MKYFKTWIDLIEETKTASPEKIRADSLEIREKYSEEALIHAVAQIALKRGGQKARAALKKLFEDTETLTTLTDHIIANHYVQPKLSHHKLFHIQAKNDLPNSQMEDIARDIRDDLGRDAIEPNFERKMRDSTQETAAFFSNCTVQMEIRYKDQETKGQSKS